MKNKFIKFIFSLVFILGLIYIFFNSKKIKKYEDSKFLFGTYIKVVVYSKDKFLADNSIKKAFAEIERIDKKFNSKSQGSLLYNLDDSYDKILGLDEEGKYIFKEIKKTYELSNKKYDITIAPLIKLWGFTEEYISGNSIEELKVPSIEAINRAKEKINFGDVKLEGYKLIIRKGLEIDTGSFLKGYAILRAGEVIKENGVDKAFISSVSSLTTIGTKPKNKKWRIGLQNPENPQELLGVVELSDMSMGVSGDYQTYVEIDGKIYHHILDKNTGYPVNDKKMVVVITENTFLADLYSTAFFLMPIEKVIKFVEQEKNLEVLIVDKDMNIIKSSNFIYEKNN